MPATLHFSNSLGALASRLVENIRNNGGDPFVAPSIATPASAMRDWLKVRIAEEMAVSANISFPHLENLLWERLAERDRFREAADRQPARLLDSFSFQGLVLAQLRRAPPPDLREYLDTGESAENARRLCQLSGKLAALFREYEYSRVAENGRPGMAESWMRGERCFGGFSNHPDVPALEAWQMKIYQALFRRDEGLRDRWGAITKTYRYTLPQYAEMVLGGASSAGETEPAVPATAPTLFHLFGLSNISPFHRNLIGRLADAGVLGERAARFEIYALNPCAEFWEDALTDRERQARAARRSAKRVPPEVVEKARPTRAELDNGEIADAPGENALLASFGKPGRETIKLWCQLTGHDFEEDFRQPPGSTLLATVQKSVLSRLGELPPAGGPEEITRATRDASLRILSAPDPRAELEAVRAEAAELLRRDPGLRPEEMAIIPANPDAALPLIRAVFAGGREVPGNVPVLLPGGDAPGGGPLLRGFRDMLSPGVLAGDRNAVLALLENPAVSRKAGLGADRVGAVRAFLEAAGFQEGWETIGGEETDGIGGNSTARDAEERAVLALVLDANDEALERDGLWPARGVTGLLEREEIARLITWLSGLRETLRPFLPSPAAPSPARPFGEWAGILRTLLDDFFEPEEDGAADKRAELDLRRFFAEMEQWDHLDETPDTADGDLVRTLLEDAFRDPGEARTAFLRGGVRVGSLSALRGIPFRHVWVTGLAAGEFPASGEAAPLDLRGYRRLPGESDPAARDLYSLLEVITSATDTLTLSWTRRDAARDAEVPPSRALTALKAWLESDVLEKGSAIDGGGVFPFGEALRAPAFAEPAPAAIPASPAWASPERPSGQTAPGAHAAPVEFASLADYLRNPIAHAATWHFRLRPYDALDFEEEERAAALFLDRRQTRGLLDPAFRAALLEPGSEQRALDQRWTPLARGGRVPPPPYGALEAARLRNEVGNLADDAAALRELLHEKGLRFAGSLRVGPQDARSVEAPVVSVPAFDASPLGFPMRVGGVLPWFFQGSGSGEGWALLVDEGGEPAAYLLQLCAAALEAPGPLRGPGHLFVRGKKGALAARALPAMDRDEARKHLGALLADFTRGPDFDDLPLHVIEDIREGAGKKSRAVANWSEEIEAQRREDEEKPQARLGFRDRVLRALRPAVPADAGEKIARRVLPYLEWKSAGEEA